MSKIIKRLLIVSLLTSVPLVLSLAPPAVADDDFTKGCQLYTAQNYTQAEPLLTETVKKFPKFWPGHYYLAHTLLALGQRTAARKEYEACLTSQPPPGADVVSACQKVIVSLGGTAPDPAGTTEVKAPPGDAKPVDGKPVAADVGEKKEEPESLRDKERRWHIERLRKQCSDRITAIREDLKEALASAERQSNKWVKGEDGDTRRIVIPDDVEAAIQKEYQDKITRVQDDTEREISGIH